MKFSGIAQKFSKRGLSTPVRHGHGYYGHHVKPIGFNGPLLFNSLYMIGGVSLTAGYCLFLWRKFYESERNHDAHWRHEELGLDDMRRAQLENTMRRISEIIDEPEIEVISPQESQERKRPANGVRIGNQAIEGNVHDVPKHLYNSRDYISIYKPGSIKN